MKKNVLFMSIFLVIFLSFFETSVFPSDTSSKRYFIEISISQCRLYLYENQEEILTLVEEYEVATVKKGLPVYPLGKGHVTKIEFNPPWLPTEYSRWYFREKKGINLPSYVPPGHPLNYMGTFKIHLSHKTCKGNVYRIHGNNDPTSVGKRVTGGCIRMHNKEGGVFAKIINIGTEVNILE